MDAFMVTELIIFNAAVVVLFIAFKTKQNTLKLRQNVAKGDKIRFKYNGNTYNEYVECVGFKNNKKVVKVIILNKKTHHQQTITLPVSKIKLSK